MKKVLLTFVVFCTVGCYTLAFAATGQSRQANLATATSSVTSSEEENVNCAVSIGTVEAQRYSESGLSLNYFSGVNYVAKISEGIYMGFLLTEGYDYDEETGGYILTGTYACFEAISSTEEAVTIPDSIAVGGEVYPVTQIYSNNNLYNGFNANIKRFTIPSTVNKISGSNYNFSRYLDAVYMLGPAPSISVSYFNPSKIYVCDKSCYASYLNSSNISSDVLSPYGWNFEWVTVNVEKNGEFAETYLTQNDYDWGAAQYVKVTGNINDIDLSAIKNLTALIKLDLSEIAITALPGNFMSGRTSLQEIILPSTLESIGSYAFSGCTALQKFDLNGITTIESAVFNDCRSLAYLNLNGAQTIGNGAFSGCTNLNGIDLSTVEYIGTAAFYNCSALDSVDLTSAISVGLRLNGYGNYDGAFQNCTSLRSVTFGDKLQAIYESAFYNTALETVSIPEGITYLDEEIFRNCFKLTSVDLPGSLKTINRLAFAGCSSLTAVSMKTGLLTIGTSAFSGCTSLEEVVIPPTVTSIQVNAFSNTGIKNFKCYAVVPPVATGSFIGGEMDMSCTYLYVPPFSKDFYRNTRYWSNFYLMRSIQEQIDYILVDRPLTINLEEEDNEVVANNPAIVLSDGYIYDEWEYYTYAIGQLTATGEGTLSAGQMTVNMTNQSRNYGNSRNACPTLINYADKMRADNVTINMSFNNSSLYSTDWYFISLPYDVKVADIVPSNDTQWVIRRYDAAARAAGEMTATWVNLTNDDVMEAGKGYIVSLAGGETVTDEYGGTYTAIRLSFTSGNSLTKNNLFRSTDIIVPLTEYVAEFAHNRSWNLVGNPYPCYFDMHYLNEEFTAPITVWDGNSYTAYSPVDDDLVLAPYEAFFVQCPLNVTEMTFKETGRRHSKDLQNARAASMCSEPVSVAERNVFNFVIADDENNDRARIVLNPDAKMEYEVGRDASKFFAENSEHAQLYVHSDVNYSIDERPVGEGVATLGLRSAKERTCTLSLSGKYSDDWNVMLTDNLTGATVDLTEESYSFITTPADNSDRFTVKFESGTKSITAIDTVIADFGADAVVTVTTIDGVTVYTGSLSDIQLPAAGLYVVSNGKEARKIVFK